MKIDTIVTEEAVQMLARGEQPPTTFLLFQLAPVDDGRVAMLMTEDGWKEFLALMANTDERTRRGIVRSIGNRFGWQMRDEE